MKLRHGRPCAALKGTCIVMVVLTTDTGDTLTAPVLGMAPSISTPVPAPWSTSKPMRPALDTAAYQTDIFMHEARIPADTEELLLDDRSNTGALVSGGGRSSDATVMNRNAPSPILMAAHTGTNPEAPVMAEMSVTTPTKRSLGRLTGDWRAGAATTSSKHTHIHTAHEYPPQQKQAQHHTVRYDKPDT